MSTFRYLPLLKQEYPGVSLYSPTFWERKISPLSGQAPPVLTVPFTVMKSMDFCNLWMPVWPSAPHPCSVSPTPLLRELLTPPISRNWSISALHIQGLLDCLCLATLPIIWLCRHFLAFTWTCRLLHGLLNPMQALWSWFCIPFAHHPLPSTAGNSPPALFLV